VPNTHLVPRTLLLRVGLKLEPLGRASQWVHVVSAAVKDERLYATVRIGSDVSMMPTVDVLGVFALKGASLPSVLPPPRAAIQRQLRLVRDTRNAQQSVAAGKIPCEEGHWMVPLCSLPDTASLAERNHLMTQRAVADNLDGTVIEEIEAEGKFWYVTPMPEDSTRIQQVVCTNGFKALRSGTVAEGKIRLERPSNTQNQ
jgi:hypothetical protein